MLIGIQTDFTLQVEKLCTSEYKNYPEDVLGTVDYASLGKNASAGLNL